MDEDLAADMRRARICGAPTPPQQAPDPAAPFAENRGELEMPFIASKHSGNKALTS